MKLNFPSIRSAFGFKKKQNTQHSDINGSSNTVNQTINHIYVTTTSENLRRELLASSDSSASLPHTTGLESSEGSDQEEIARIIEYRSIANGGNSEAALDLLKKLDNDQRYASGYLAFRLHFNIGIVQQNIGELEDASASLKKAHAHYPENYKAQAGLALSKSIDGLHEEAFKKAHFLLKAEGDHQSLAACIVYHTATILGRHLEDEDFGIDVHSYPEVVIARLEYLQKIEPENYQQALNKAIAEEPENEFIAVLWASSILDDVKQNQAFLLGAKMPDDFEDKISKSAEILRKNLESALEQHPPNKLLLSSQANNAAIALRLSGNTHDASRLLDRVLERYPDLKNELARIRATLLLQEDRDSEALELISPLTEDCELQVLASELEAHVGDTEKALARINTTLNSRLPDSVAAHALSTKAKISIKSLNQNSADEALEDLVVIAPGTPELALLRSAYDRAFSIHTQKELLKQTPSSSETDDAKESELLDSLRESETWDFITRLQVADELLARKHFRECSRLLENHVSLSKESPALKTLCDSCLYGHLGSLANQINEGLSDEVKKSTFGLKFGANVAHLSGQATKAVPLTRRLFEQNPSSIKSLEFYIQSLLKTNDHNRIYRLIREIDEKNLTGTVAERRRYVQILVFCGETKRARDYAYALFCENQNNHEAWMALSSSILELGNPAETREDLQPISVGADATFKVLKPDGDSQTFTVESDENLLSLREGSISPNHPIALAALGKTKGDAFNWPIKSAGKATVLDVKHKALAAFHMILSRFEERFPEADGFKSVPINFEREDGLDEMKAMLRKRAEYSHNKAVEYRDGAYPIFILGYQLGVGPIEAFLGLKTECGLSAKVSSCSQADQNKAKLALLRAKLSGIVVDSTAVYLIRRLGLEGPIAQEFGQIGVTQETLDIFARRLQQAEGSVFSDPKAGHRKSANIAICGDQIVLNELAGQELEAKINSIRADLEWLNSNCEVIPSVAKNDPDDTIIRFRSEEGGRFFDDIFACDGSGRVLISDDYHVRQWAEQIFQVQGAWIQELLFFLEWKTAISIQTTVISTIHLCHLGEEALSINAERLIVAAEMLSEGLLSEYDFDIACSVLGQPHADMRSHIEVASAAIRGLWANRKLVTIRQKATSIILHNIVRFQGKGARVVLDAIQAQLVDERAQRHLSSWRIGHFIV